MKAISLSKISIPILILTVTISSSIFAQDRTLSGPPNALDKFGTVGSTALKAIFEALNTSWQKSLAFFQKILDWLKNTWNTYIWHKVNPRIGEEFEKERKEMVESIKKDLPFAFNAFWIKIKSFFK